MPHLYKKKTEDASLTTNKPKTKTLHSIFPTTLVIIRGFFMVQNFNFEMGMFYLNITNRNVYSCHIIWIIK